MQIVDSQIHLWENARMSPQHRQIPTYNVDDALKEMAEAGVEPAVIHPPSTLGEAPNVQAVEAVKAYPAKFCILGNFDLQAPNREDIVRNWRQRPGMLGFRFTFNQPHQQSWWSDGSLDWFWAACEEQGIPLMMFLPGTAEMALPIVQRHPALTIVFDHMARNLALRVATLRLRPRPVRPVGFPDMNLRVGDEHAGLPRGGRIGRRHQPMRRSFERLRSSRGGCMWLPRMVNDTSPT